MRTGARQGLRPDDAQSLAVIAAAKRDVSVEEEVDGLVSISSLIHGALAESGETSRGLRQAMRESREVRIRWETEEGMESLQALLWSDPECDAVERAFLEMAAAVNKAPDSPQAKWVMENDDLILDAARLQKSERSTWPARTALVNAGLIAQGAVGENHQPLVAWPAHLAIDVLQAAAQGGIFSPEDHPESLYALVKQAGGGVDHAWSVYRALGWKGYTKNMVADVADVADSSGYVANVALTSLAACASAMVDGTGPLPGSEEWAQASEVWRGAAAACMLGVMHPDREVRLKATQVSLSLRGNFRNEDARAFDAELVQDVMGLMH